jgi:hypothetical protein
VLEKTTGALARMALAWEQDMDTLLNQSTETRESGPVCDGHREEWDGYLRNNAVEILLELAEVYGTDVGTVIHGLVLWDRLVYSSKDKSGFQNMLRASVACFMISAKLREVQHPAIQDLANFTSFQSEDLLRSEESVLLSLDWNINSLTGGRFFFRLVLCR